jgi:CHAD domain-containing protein
MELFLPILPKEQDELYAAISSLQELMGEVHDVDVQAEVVADWAALHESFVALPVLRSLSQRRRSLLRQTRQHFQEMIAVDFEGRLQRILTELA